MNTKIEKSEKNICFSTEKCFEYLNHDIKKWFYYKTAAKTFGQRIRAVNLQYSSGEVMRNPYRQAV